MKLAEIWIKSQQCDFIVYFFVFFFSFKSNKFYDLFYLHLRVVLFVFSIFLSPLKISSILIFKHNKSYNSETSKVLSKMLDTQYIIDNMYNTGCS